MKEKTNETKKEIRIPKVVVYVLATIMVVLLSVGVSLLFGVGNAIDCITVAAIVAVLSHVLYDIGEKVSNRKYALTLKYWLMCALVLLCDLSFFFTSQSKTYEVLPIRASLFGVLLIATIFYAYFVYKPSVMSMAEQLEKNLAKAFADYITNNTGKTPEEIGEGLVGLLKEGK